MFDVVGDEFETIAFGRHLSARLRCIVAIHSTALGPAVGGTRLLPYEGESEALADVCRLARGMSYKHALADLDAGGGKAVIMAPSGEWDRRALFEAYGGFLNGLAGRYLTAEDVGTTESDMDTLRTVSAHVTGFSRDRGGSGDPSSATAVGVHAALRAAVAHRFGSPDLTGRHVTIAGAGKVGSALAGHLLAAGCRLSVADPDGRAAQRVRDLDRDRVGLVAPGEAHRVACEVFSPCALGGVLTDGTIAEIGAQIVVGAANNQLGSPEDGRRLADAGILYVPDYVANAGGVVNIAHERHPDGYERERALAQVRRIGETAAAVLRRAETEGVAPSEAADRLAVERLAVAEQARRGSDGAESRDGAAAVP